MFDSVEARMKEDELIIENVEMISELAQCLLQKIIAEKKLAS
jgi:hypothetical protein